MELKDILETLFKDFVWQPLMKKVVERILISLGLGPAGFLGWIVTEIVMRVGAEVLYHLDKFIDMKAVVIKDLVHRKAFNDAGIALHQLAISGVDINSKEFLDARNKLGDDLSKFVSITRV